MKRRGRQRRPQLFLKGRSPRARRRLLAVFLLVFGAGSARIRGECLELGVGFDLSTTPYLPKACVADFDRDGDLDVAGVSVASDLVVWLENDGGDSAWAQQTIAVLGNPYAIVCADVDGDGDADVAAVANVEGDVVWYANDGAGGGWSAQVVFTEAPGVSELAASDFDRDGDLDFAATSQNDDAVRWFEQGAGDSWAAHTILSGVNNPAGLVAADIDGDGDPDLAVAFTGPDRVFWFANDGAGGGWTLRTVTLLALGARGVDAGDIDRDGDVDLVSASSLEDKVAWHENTAGTGLSWTLRTISSFAGGARSVFLVDLDGDGDLDAVASSPEDGDLDWFENTTGTGSSFRPHAVVSGTPEVGSSPPADLDGDGDLDLLVSDPGFDATRWRRNDRLHGAALFGPLQSISTFGLAPRSLAIADLDGDGDLDPLIANNSGDAIDWWRNNGSASGWVFQEPVGSAEGSNFALAGDLDRDGDLDLVGGATIAGSLTWYQNDGLGSFPSSAIDLALTTPEMGALADFDGNGTLDVAVSDSGLDAVYWYANDGTPSAGSWTRLTVATGFSILRRLEAVDLDRDGDVDLLATDSILDAAFWLENSGATVPAWTKRTLADAVDSISAIGTGDLDADGDLDALLTTAIGTMLWLESDSTPATGAWTRHTVVTSFGELFDLAAADLDGDGDLDAAVVGGPDNAIVLFENDGSGLFTTSTAALLVDAIAVESADLDRDGDLDLALTTQNALVWLPNLGTRVHDDGFDSDANTACWSNVAP